MKTFDDVKKAILEYNSADAKNPEDDTATITFCKPTIEKKTKELYWSVVRINPYATVYGSINVFFDIDFLIFRYPSHEHNISGKDRVHL